MCIDCYFTVSEGAAVSGAGLVLLNNYCHNGNMILKDHSLCFPEYN